MLVRPVLAAIGLLSVFSATGADAQTLGDCESALIQSTYSRQDRRFLDRRLAERVDERTYEEIRRNASVNATIYGVPMGANFEQFRTNGRNFHQDRQQALTQEEAQNILWTGLDPNSVSTYSQCLSAYTQSRPGIHFIPRGATDTDITFEVVYTIASTMPNPLRVEWIGGNVARGILPTALPAGRTTVIVLRPDRQHRIAANGGGLTDSIILTPLPPLPDPPVPPAPLALECTITLTPEPLPLLRKNGTASWTCPRMQAGTYVASVAIDPQSSPAIPFRVGWTMTLIHGEGANRSTIELNRASGSPIDINANAGIGTNFRVHSQPVEIAEGAPIFTLRVDGVANHCCFDRTNHDDGAVVVPQNVSLTLRRQ